MQAVVQSPGGGVRELERAPGGRLDARASPACRPRARAAGRAGRARSEWKLSATLLRSSPPTRTVRGSSSTRHPRGLRRRAAAAGRRAGRPARAGASRARASRRATLRRSVSPVLPISVGSCAVSGMPAITSTPWSGPRESTRATTLVPGRSVMSGSCVWSSSVLTATTGSTTWVKVAERLPITGSDGPRSLHRCLRHARRADPAGPDRQRPGQCLHARLQGRPDGAALVRRPSARQLDQRRRRRPSEHGRAGRLDRDRLQPQARRARPASRSTSRSTARASSPSRPRRASATPATASSRSTPRAGS